MRLLYLHPSAWTGEYPMLACLRDLGHEVCVLEENRTGKGPAWRHATYFRESGDAIQTLWYDPHRGFSRLLTWPVDRVFRRAFEGRNLVHRMLVIHRAVLELNPDVVICTDGFSYAIPASFLKALRLLKKPLMASYIGGDILDCPEAAVGKRRTRMVSWLIRTSVRHVDAMRPLCRSLAEILLHEGADPQRVHVLPIQLTASASELASVRRDRALISSRVRARYGIASDAPLVVTLSGNQKGKGLHLLASQWQRIVNQHPEARWLLCGPPDPWLRSAVLPQIERAGLLPRVTLVGSLSGMDVFEHLATADIHVNPTLCEGLNMVTVEAASVGTPTVTSDGAGIADWVRRLECGLVVPAGDDIALGSAVIDALSDRNRLLTWQERCSTMAPDFEVTRIARRLVDLARSISAPPSVPQGLS